MQQKQIFYKSDFSAILSFDGGWLTPFKLKFWTNSPSRSFTASFDGTKYTNCSLLEDGRLLIAFDSHNMGLGTLMLQPEFYLTDADYNDGICNEVITQFAPTFVDTDGTEYTLALSFQGESTMETVGTLPAYYQKGDKGADGADGADGEDASIVSQTYDSDGNTVITWNDGTTTTVKKGEKGEPGGVVYPSFEINDNGHLICIVPTTEADISVKLENGRLIITVA